MPDGTYTMKVLASSQGKALQPVVNTLATVRSVSNAGTGDNTWLLEVDGGWVLLDHKANPAPRDRWEQVAKEHSGQLSIYADALVHVSGRPVKETWIVLPISAGAIQITMKNP